jgi:Xaa-Pro aminopeptidase
VLLNTTRIPKVLEAWELDALVATTPANFLYASGYDRTLPFVVGAKVAAIVAGDPPGLAALVLPRIEAPSVSELPESPNTVILYGSFSFAFAAEAVLDARDRAARALLERAPPLPSFREGLFRALSELGLGQARLGWDDPALMAELSEDRPPASNVDGRKAWRWLRRVKSDEEIRLLTKSASITEAIEAELIARSTEGAYPGDLKRVYEEMAVSHGAVPGFWSSGGGSNAAVIVSSSPGKLQTGQVMRFDFGCQYGHYWSDTGRTVSVGPPSPLLRQRYEALRTGIAEGWKSIRPGAVPADIFTVVVDSIRDAGFRDYDRHHVGHSIGIEMYDGTMISRDDAEPLEVGMVINLEVPYYEVGWGGLQIEDTAVVGRNEPIPLTHLSRELTVN